MMQLPIPYSRPISSAQLKVDAADFIVRELLEIDHSQNGEHYWIYLSKTNLNTAYIARLLSQWAGVPIRDIGYSGLKDRHAITYQWFSIRLPHKQLPEVGFEQFASTKLHDGESVQIIDDNWHHRKLNRGTHKHNQFSIRLRQLQGDKTAIDEALGKIATCGVPNYFGLQRFGHQGNNLPKTQQFFDKLLSSPHAYRPNKKFAERDGLMISTARSILFNAMLASRVQDGTWNQAIKGDVLNLDGTGSIFEQDDTPSGDIISRIQSADIHPTAPLYGVGTPRHTADAQQKYAAVLGQSELEIYQQGLIKIQSKLSYRPLRMMVRDLTWLIQGDELQLNFILPKGSFATVVLAALVVDLQENAAHEADNKNTVSVNA
ncbi:tRNA pseudouridine(13) synthase TruD [Moraxella cuniculi]|nr:tRNA pseudouridine(13) synthase TruD [Moraxella cuniculi]OOS07219.1 pseudouridine synthase [Moraxella cuniculi]